ncbi:hypothetical protein FACS1894200_10170 [Spirochaetia bacterium]|nr:hypothetical protein FACS1894200_10170 [Spirochaetia bacterium]
MTRGIVIVGNESNLTNALLNEAAKRVSRFVSVIIPNRLTGFELETPGPANPSVQERLSWNPGSPISARTLLLAAENRLEHIDDAVLVCSPPSVCCPPEKLVLREIETMVNDHFIGWFYLVKELSSRFRTQMSGTLSLIVYEPPPAKSKDGPIDLLGPAAAASFRAFSQSLLTQAINEPFLTLGFSLSESVDDAACGTFIFKIIDERNKRDNGKWHKYGKFLFFK